MEKFIPLEKRSKKEQRELNLRSRGSWHGVNPCTKVVPSKKGYNRQQAKRASAEVF